MQTLFKKVMIPEVARCVIYSFAYLCKNLGVLRRIEKLFDCPGVLKSSFDAYILSRLEYCALVRMSSGQSQLGLLGSIVRGCARVNYFVWGTERRWSLFAL